MYNFYRVDKCDTRKNERKSDLMNVKTNKIITCALALIISAGATGAGAAAKATSEGEREFVSRLCGAETGSSYAQSLEGTQEDSGALAYEVDTVRALSTLVASGLYDSGELTRALTQDGAQERRAMLIDAWEIFLSLGSVKDKNVSSYKRKTVTVGTKTLTEKSLTINGKDYIPSRRAAESLGLKYNYNSATKTVEISGSGLSMSFSHGCYVSYANGRPLFSTTPAMIMSDGRMYIPAEILAKAFGLRYSQDSAAVRLTGSYSPLAHADSFYREDEVFWLARIIHAEAQGEPLLGQIAVGNVVLNRVRSAYYPNTIYGVIFDRKYGVQFSPILDGSIYNNPSYNAILAAKICLEGTDVSDGTFFFLRPEISSSSWIPNNRKYAFSIGKHDFYY